MPYITLCPTCKAFGQVVQNAPHTKRRCRNGHQWLDGRTPRKSPYVSMRDRIAEAKGIMENALVALKQAETMIRDCASLLTPAQRAKLAVPSELHKIEQQQITITGGIILLEERVVR